MMNGRRRTLGRVSLVTRYANIETFQLKSFLFITQNIDCVYTLELSCVSRTETV